MQITLLNHIVCKLYSYTNKSDQLKELHWLIFQQKNLLLIAKTLYDKSMLFQTLMIIQNSDIALLILSLNVIDKKQLAKIKSMSSVKSVLLNHATVNKQILQNIKNEKHTHVLLDSEMTLRPKFWSISTDLTFKLKMIIMTVDEIHLIKQWDNKFHQEYTKWMMLREWLDVKMF